MKNYKIIDQAPLQVYCAGLIFAPQTSIIRNEFEHEIPTWICQLPQVEQEWGAELQTLDSYIQTKSGAIHIQSRCKISTPHSPRVYSDISIEHGRQWIKLNGKRLLWLPVKFRPKTVQGFQVSGHMVALGLPSRGSVAFLQFCV